MVDSRDAPLQLCKELKCPVDGSLNSSNLDHKTSKTSLKPFPSWAASQMRPSFIPVSSPLSHWPPVVGRRQKVDVQSSGRQLRVQSEQQVRVGKKYH